MSDIVKIQNYIEAIVDTRTRAVLQSVTTMIGNNDAEIVELKQRCTDLEAQVVTLQSQLEALT